MYSPWTNKSHGVKKDLLPGPGLCNFFRGFNGPGWICMGRQFVTMGMRVRCMSRRKRRFRDSFMLLMRQEIIHGMVAGVFQMTFTVLAGPGFYNHFFLIPAWG
jgi:hypothetical protein